MRLKYYAKLFSGTIPFFTFMGNSLKMSTVITLGMVFHGAIAGYAYAKFNFPGKKPDVWHDDGSDDGSGTGDDCCAI